MAAVSIDPSGPVSFSNENWSETRTRAACLSLFGLNTLAPFVSPYDEISDCSCSLIAVGTPPNPVGHTQKRAENGQPLH